MQSVTALNPSDILSIEELAKRLQVSRRGVYEKTRAHCPNQIPHFKIGRAIRFNWIDVSEWIAANKRGAS